MKETEKILCENLRETLRQFQRYLLWAIGSSISFLALSVVEVKSENIQVPIPGLFVSVNADFAKLITFAIFWIVGALAAYAYENAQRIVAKFEADSEVLQAVLTFPSIATEVYPAVRILPVLFPCLLVLSGLLVGWIRGGGEWGKWLFGLPVVFAPYFTLMFFLTKEVLPIEKPKKLQIGENEKQ